MVAKIAAELNLGKNQIDAVLKLIEDGCTIPFIARYRKEVTGSLDEVQIAQIRDRNKEITELEHRRAFILSSIEEQGKLTDELKKQIVSAENTSRLEDLYLPYKPKRRTRAMIAREKGLEPLSDLILADKCNPFSEAEKYVSSENGVDSPGEALQGARDIIAEKINEDEKTRALVRNPYRETAVIFSKVKKGQDEKGAKYRDYFESSEKMSKIPAHRVLAIFRGENEGILSVGLEVDEERCQSPIIPLWIKSKSECGGQILQALEDSFKRLIFPSLETEYLAQCKKDADQVSIHVFAKNLRDILMEAPFGNLCVLAVDPGFRTGCKIAIISAAGALLDHGVIYALEPYMKTEEAEKLVRSAIKKYEVKAIAVGNGTGGRESVDFLTNLKLEIPVVMVNESGASVYSASDVARKEFPDQDVTVRGAVSIGRRLMDPLSELVKIDPKAIGVGQYQHDVDQTQLKESLDETVMSCVNSVGVQLNTASEELLQYVSGLNKKTAGSIVKYRQSKGSFKKREELLKVAGLGPKAYEQAAGFLRIPGGENVLDQSAVHPESYPVVHSMAVDLGCQVSDLMTDHSKLRKIDLGKYVTKTIGLPTLKDILSELEKPGRDPRAEFQMPAFDQNIRSINDLKEGMVLQGIITNVSAFGAFVDIGVHQDGLVHISEISNTFVKDIHSVVKVRQKVQVRVLTVDVPRKRISLSMKE